MVWVGVRKNIIKQTPMGRRTCMYMLYHGWLPTNLLNLEGFEAWIVKLLNEWYYVNNYTKEQIPEKEKISIIKMSAEKHSGKWIRRGRFKRLFYGFFKDGHLIGDTGDIQYYMNRNQEWKIRGINQGD
jgi:hypothetical protein